VKIGAVSTILAAVVALALLLVSMPVVAASGLTSGYAKIKDWDRAHQAFSFSSGQVTSSGGDFFIAPRGIHVFESPGIIDMGLIHLDAIGEAPASGYVEMTTPIDGHSYVVRSNGKYGKFYIEETYDWLDPVEYGISWVYQTNGTRTFEGSSSSVQSTTSGQPGTGAATGCTYEQYMAAYNKLTSLMAQGKGDTPEAQAAYAEYAKVKACYESGSTGTGQTTTPGQTGTEGGYECPQNAADAYQQYLAAYNKLTYLMNKGEGGTPEAKAAYEQYVKAKACYETGSSGTGTPSTSSTSTSTSTSTTTPATTISTTTTPSTTTTSQQTGCTQYSIPPAGKWSGSWFSTGISLPARQTISVTASGTVQPSLSRDIFCGPEGTFADGTWLNNYSFLSDCGHAALIARIGATGTPFCVGTGTTFSTPTGGDLWLGINDTDTGNNSGSYAVEVCLGQASSPSPSSTGFGTTAVLNVGFKGNIYYLEEGTSQLPDFSTMLPVGTIYTEKLDIPDRDFTEGFPGITDRFEWFGISYIGGILIPTDGYYIFKLTSDDGTKLYIDGEMIIDNDGIHPSRTQTKQMFLARGNHVIKVDYFQGPKTRLCLQLLVQTPDGGENPVKPGLDPSQIVSPSPTSITSTTSTTTPTSIPAGTALIAESRTAAPGSTIQVPVNFQNAQNVGSLGFKLDYNPSVVQVVKVSKGSLMSPATFTSNVQPDYIIFGFAMPQSISGTGSAAVVEFQALGAEGSKSPLTLTEIMATGSSGAALSVNSVNGELSIGQKQIGDANGDGKLSVLDALIALKMYVQLLPLDLVADINKDGRVTPEDARLILEKAKP